MKTKNLETRKGFNKGDFCAKKNGVPFTNLFMAKIMEQQITVLKIAGGIMRTTQNESVLNSLPVSLRFDSDFLYQYSSANGTCTENTTNFSNNISSMQTCPTRDSPEYQLRQSHAGFNISQFSRRASLEHACQKCGHR